MSRMKLILGALLLAALPMMIGAVATYGPTPVANNYRTTVNLPDTSFVAVGRQMNVWYDAMSTAMPGMTPTSWVAYADSGRALDRAWRWTPVAAKTQTLTVKPVDANGIVGAAATMIVRGIAADAGSGEARILFIGDSLLDGSSVDTTTSSQVISLVDSLVNVTDTGAGTLVTIGTQGTTFMGEGRSGYTTTHFTQSSQAAGRYNPFWDADPGRVSFRDYMTRHSLTGPIDYAVVMLGWNDVAALGGANATVAQIDAIVANLDTLVSVLKDPIRGYADCRVLVCTSPVGANSIAGFGISYSASPTFKDDWPYWQANIRRLNAAIIERFDDDGTYTDDRDQVDVVPVHLWVDRVYGYPFSTPVVSARSPSTALQHTNFVHPNYSGRDQEADAMYSALRHGFAMPNPINLLSESELFGTWTATGSPGWVGWLANTAVADVDSAAGQQWSFTTNTLTYFSLAAGLTVQESNLISCYFRRTSGVLTQVELLVDEGTGGHDRWLKVSLNTDTGGLMNAMDNLYGAVGYAGTINADSSYFWHRITHVGGNWVRVSFSFDHMYSASDDDLGVSIDNVRVYINSNAAGVGTNVGIIGAQFEQGVRRPSAYVPKP